MKKRMIRNKNDKRLCPVVCENLNLHFNTITKAAKYAKVDGWTMSKKMETAGQFVDKNGNIYKRLKAMKTKNVYENTGDSIKTSRAFAHRINKKSKSLVTTSIPVVKESPVDTKYDLAKSILKDKAISSIQSNDFTTAKNLLDVISELK